MQHLWGFSNIIVLGIAGMKIVSQTELEFCFNFNNLISCIIGFCSFPFAVMKH